MGLLIWQAPQETHIKTPPITYPKFPPSLNVYGKLVDFSQTDKLMIFKIQSEIVNWELTDRYLEVESNLTDVDVTKGNNYVFYFMKLSEKEGPWDRVTISKDLTEYKQRGKRYHENDLTIDQMTITEGGGGREGELKPEPVRGMRIIPTTIIAGEPTELKILLINKQDNDIKYKITDAKIVNEQASQWYGSWWQLPPYEERLKNAIIDECDVNFDSSESIIPAGSNKTLTFTVYCPEGTNITKTYEICDDYKERRNCRIETADRTDNLMLWGKIEFVDELGNEHIFPGKGILKQFLAIGQKSGLEVEYSKEISSKEEFYIYANYKDSTGAQIENAQVEIRFKNLGVTGVFPMRYDNRLSKYRFLWSDFVEWDPGYKKGRYEFTITAKKSGYATQQKSYTFELK